MQATTITPDSNHAGAVRLVGFSIREDAGAAARVELRDGSSTGQVLWELDLAADESASIVFAPSHFHTPDGVYVAEATGSVTGVLFHR